MRMTSPMFLPLYSTSSVAALKRMPLHTSQCTRVVGMKFISTFTSPLPAQASQRPPSVL